VLFQMHLGFGQWSVCSFGIRAPSAAEQQLALARGCASESASADINYLQRYRASFKVAITTRSPPYLKY
jgi:hypothetical protein